jgi:hypothetical protein
MNNIVISIIIFIEFILLIIHSFYVRGKKNTLWFFGVGLIYSFIREFNMSHTTRPLYQGTSLLFFGVPFLILIGWVFHFYLSLWLAEKVLGLRKYKITSNRIYAITIISAFFMVVFSLAGEPIGAALGWWSWNKSNVYDLLWFLGMPINVLMGWFLTGGMFVFSYLVFLSKYRIKLFSLVVLFLSALIYPLSTWPTIISCTLLGLYFVFCVNYFHH